MSTRMLDLLPAIYRDDATLGPFLQAFEELLLGLDDNPPPAGQPRALEKQIDHLADNFYPQGTPLHPDQRTPQEFLDWLASWVALSLRADFTPDQQRDFLANTAQRYRRRGTPRNLEELLKIFTLGTPHVVEDGQLAHRFAVEFGLLSQSRYGGTLKDYPAYVEQQSSRAREVIELEKPAHTDFELRPIFPTFRISPKTAVSNAATPGYFSTIGVDTLLGAAVLDPIAPTVAITATPSTINLGQSATLVWSTTNAGDSTASGGWSGKVSADGSQKVTPTAEGTASYTLTVSGIPGSGGGDTAIAKASATASLKVLPPLPTVSFTVLPATIAVGSSITLTWAATNATSATANSNPKISWTGVRPISGSETIKLTTVGTMSFDLICTGSSGTTTETRTVQVLPLAPVVTIKATPAAIVRGQSTTLSWTATDATSAAADGSNWSGSWTGADASNGSATVTPAVAGDPTNYVLIVKGAGGSTTATVKVAVSTPLPVVTISATPAAIALGQSTVLRWTATDATSAVADGPNWSGTWTGASAANGSATVTPTTGTTTSYPLKVTGPGGTTTASVSVAVTPPPTATFTPSMNPTNVGLSTTLTWTSSNATTAVASGGAYGWAGSRPVNGSFVFKPTGPSTATYTLTFSGPAGTKVLSLTITARQ